MWDGSHDMGWWMVLWMTLASIAWVGLIAFLIYSLTGGWGATPTGQAASSTQETPLEIASRRYASGDLSEEEYDRISNKLR